MARGGGLVARRRRRDQALFAVPDQVATPHVDQRVVDDLPVVRVVVAQQRLVQFSSITVAHHVHLFRAAGEALQRVAAGVPHGGGHRHRRRGEGLHLVEAEVVLLQPQRQVDHVFVAGARVGGDEVRDQVLLLAGLAAEALEQLLELVVGAHARLHHLRQRAFFGVFRRDLQVAADVVLHQLLDVLRRFHRQVVAQAGLDVDLLDARQRARLAIQLDQRAVVGAQVLAHVRIDTGQLATGTLDLRVLAAQAVHVGGRAAQVGDVAGEARRLVADFLDLFQDRFFRTALDDAAFVLGDGAEGTAAETAAHDVDRVLDHLPRRDVRVAVARVRIAGVGRAEHEVHFLGGQRDRWRRQPHVARAVALHQRAGVAGIGFQVQGAAGVCVQYRIMRHRLVGRDADHGLGAFGAALGQALLARFDADHLRLGRIVAGGGLGRLFRNLFVRVEVDIDLARHVDHAGIHLLPLFIRQPAVRHHEGGTADVAHLGQLLAARGAVGDFHQRALGVAVQQDVGLGVHQHRRAHLLAPVVVVGDAAQRCLDAADHHADAGIGLAAALRVHRHRAIRALVGLGVRGVGVVGARAAIGGVAVDHRVHVAGGDAKEQVGLAQLAEGVGAVPVRLRDDADAETLRLQQPSDQRHAEARMVDVAVAADNDDVAGIPAQLVHLGAAHRQERRGAEALRPVFAVTVDRLWCGRKRHRGRYSV